HARTRTRSPLASLPTLACAEKRGDSLHPIGVILARLHRPGAGEIGVEDGLTGVAQPVVTRTRLLDPRAIWWHFVRRAVLKPDVDAVFVNGRDDSDQLLPLDEFPRRRQQRHADNDA